jgi:hypothetical protein
MLAASIGLAQSDQQSNPPAPAPQAQPQQQQPDQSKDKKKDKKKKDKDDPLATEAFSDRVASSVLRDLQDGLEGHVEHLLISSFDDNNMDGYLQFEDQIEQFFNKYDAIRIHYRIIQNTVEGAKGVALVEMQMEAENREGRGAPMRRDQQIRFEFDRTKKGWKISDFQPRTFFMP